jgi:hypothetical protein
VIRFAFLLPPAVVILALGAVIVVGSGWGGLWLYGYIVVYVLCLVVLITRGGDLARDWGRRHTGP